MGADMSDLLQHAGAAAALLKQLANQNRLMIVCTLLGKELSVGELNQTVPLSQSALSQHLASLREAELVSTRREGQTIYYRLNGDKAQRVVSLLKDMYCPDRG
ncbi:MAG: helix-turn-helix transcriptional regulator [Gammaproteobacteria bacterium]|uniref:ArsR/SmtB family transcription factor n=1 Tax=Pseudomaricurvus alcaniphilus TaxID=1166482 RepID=UPI00140CE21D|nr:metalloregulator ArsR/SmtB family transcription factor [Pseudomaricurvus alcaniphilus]MBR9909157.1 helix-turn-helix transcriptional regulator [Gammaproteobacteria bacterium]NHN39932.1 helix-turn-helix transcriptional regulator [Pseudomaricurvus alcaniphilus]